MGLSIRAYARQRGVTEGAVRKAIKAGRITTAPDGGIDPARADIEWQRNTSPAQQHKTGTHPPTVLAIPQQVWPTLRHPSADSEQRTGNPAAPNYQSSRAIRETYNAKITRLVYEERM